MVMVPFIIISADSSCFIFTSIKLFHLNKNKNNNNDHNKISLLIGHGYWQKLRYHEKWVNKQQLFFFYLKFTRFSFCHMLESLTSWIGHKLISCCPMNLKNRIVFGRNCIQNETRYIHNAKFDELAGGKRKLQLTTPRSFQSLSTHTFVQPWFWPPQIERQSVVTKSREWEEGIYRPLSPPHQLSPNHHSPTHTPL